ncbi:uncharacterized protein TNCV_2496481 [Trichonephila clavipes]|nr:uncharacterized protein TNCV_2496481 [Trichonephila clavipes]
MASSTECPLFPKPRKGKGQSQKENKKRNENTQENSAFITPGLSFAQVTSGHNSQQRAARGSDSSTNDRTGSTRGWGGTAILIKRSIPHFHVPTPPLTGVEATLVALTPSDQEPFLVASIYAPPNQITETWEPTSTIDSQVSNLTDEILNAHASASRPFLPHGTTVRAGQQAWEDNLSTLNAEDNSLWGIAKAFRKKTSPISALNGPTGIALSDTNKTEVIAHSLEKQFHLNDIHNPRKDEIITSVVDAYMDSNTNNTDIIPPLSHLKLFRSLKD